MQWLFLLGMVTGARSMTSMAVLCWFAYVGRTPLHGWASWAGYLVSAIVFSVFALGEDVGDTLPKTPNRTAAFPAAARLVFGALVGALGANAVNEPAAGGVILGVLGAAVGTWGGLRGRMRLAQLFGRDLPAALLESALALALACWAAEQVARDAAKQARWWA